MVKREEKWWPIGGGREVCPAGDGGRWWPCEGDLRHSIGAVLIAPLGGEDFDDLGEGFGGSGAGFPPGGHEADFERGLGLFDGEGAEAFGIISEGDETWEEGGGVVAGGGECQECGDGAVFEEDAGAQAMKLEEVVDEVAHVEAAREECEAVACELIEGHGGALCQGVFRGGDEDKLGAEKLVVFDGGGGVAEEAEAEVHTSGLEAAFDIEGGELIDGDLDGGELGPEGAEEGDGECGVADGHHADGEDAAEGIFDFGNDPGGVVGFAEDLAGFDLEAVSGLGEADVVAVAVEEDRAEQSFELGDLAADGGLADGEALRGAGEGAGFGDGDEEAEVPEFEGGI